MKNLRKISSLLFVFLFFINAIHAQDAKIISWKTASEKIVEGSYKVTFTGIIKKGWHT